MSKRDKYDSIAYLLHSVNRKLWLAKEEVLGKKGISFQQMITLGFLKENEDKYINQKAICENNKIKGPSVTSLIGTMIKNGLIEKSVNPQDGREFFLILTKKGDELASKIKDMLDEIDEKSTAILNDSEKEEIIYLLSKLLKQEEQI